MGPLKLGSTLSQKYRVVRLLAESGGVVLYEASDLGRKQRVWVKILARESLTNADALEKFQLEASRATVLDVGKESGLPYMVATELASDADPTVPNLSPLAPPPRPAPKTAPKTAPPVPGTKKSVKSTLPGVAPPPAPMPRPILTHDEPEEEEPPPSSSIPLLAEDMIVSDEKPARPPPLAILPPPKPAPPIAPAAPPPAAAPMILEAADVPVFESRLVTPPKRELLPTLPPDGELVVRRDRRESSSTKWIAAMILVATATGVGGWYLGHARSVARPSPPSDPTTATATAAATTTATATETATATATETATETAAATATETETAPPASSDSAPPLDTTEPPKPAAQPHHPAPPAPAHPHPRRVPPAHVPAGDPLTL